ncbi:MAG: glycosyltransferase family 39 protein [Gemmatimonadota bacterium]|nr:MAG: glycosyltransferase family 39 protein [Gemmatimonadota bacterium]
MVNASGESKRGGVAGSVQEWLGPGLLAAILVVAVALRLYKLGSWPFEQDELYTLHDAEVFGEYVNFLRPLYYFLQHLLLQVLPATPLFLRLPPFVFGVLGVWLTWRLARRNFGVPAGLVAAFLASISAWHLYASQFARYWTLVYALAALLYIALPWAVDRDRRTAYGLALLVIILGTLTHPTFVFPAVGFILGVFLVSREGRLGWQPPSRRAWLFLWGPLAAVGVTGFLFLFLRGSLSGLQGTRGLAAALRLVPAMVQWATPVVVTVALIGLLYLLGRPGPDRRWGLLSTLGLASGLGLLLAAATSRSVYADYAIAMLPLVYVTVGGVVQRVGETLGTRSYGFVLAAAVVLAADVLPGTASHLSDGTRFDYRPAYAYLERTAGDNLVLGWPDVIQRYYAPDLNFKLLRRDIGELDETLKQTGGFWVVGSYRRYGMVLDNGRVSRWLDGNCRRVLRTERPRLDYRTYRVELHWCGANPPQG